MSTKPCVVEIAAHGARDLVAQAQALRHVLAAQVDVAVLEADLFAHVLVELERQRLGAVERRQLARQQLDLARGQVGIGGAGRALADQPAHLDHELVAQLFGLGKLGLVVGIEHDLQQTLAVAQVHENDAAMVAAAMDPAGNRNLLTDQLFVDLAAVVRTHGKPDETWKGRRCYRVGKKGGSACSQEELTPFARKGGCPLILP